MRFRVVMGRGMPVMLLVAAAIGCTSTPDPSGARLPVVATTTQVGSIAAEVGGTDISLRVLLPPGAEAHDYEMTPADAAAVEDAAIVLKSGAGLESWLDRALENIGGSDKVRDMSAGVALRTSAEGGTDPHYWLSGPNAIRMVTNVRDALAAAQPSAAARFRQRADLLGARLRSADARVRQLIADVPAARRKIVTNHDALGYFVAEYGLTFVGSVFPSLDVSSEPDPSTLAALVETLRAEHVTAIFSESAVNPNLARTIAAESGARVDDDPLYTDSLGPPGSGAETLDAMLVHDATVIHDALTGA